MCGSTRIFKVLYRVDDLAGTKDVGKPKHLADAVAVLVVDVGLVSGDLPKVTRDMILLLVLG